ncbi:MULTISPECIES: helix-turn-helix transcriptional regulator [unclassified Streptomyces]|uniref:helix-turn-helix domain-containing protein n=1 Tax=unclassified Streptomyces TaxID=2593676 RepID=UPI000BF484E3|nr:helix-turn-helix transcriptional regulator [Streptomyces sp. Ru87]PGH50761.1 transcriptional regulator [Streptomyces sp. Ru87]
MAHIRDLDPGSSALAYYGAELRRLREAAGLTQKQVGDIIYCTGSLVGQIETARKAPTREFTERVDAALGAEGALIRLWPLVSRSALPGWFQPYAEMEATATDIFTYQAQLVDGLLQTRDYAYAVLGAIRRVGLPERVAARMERQRLLTLAQPPLIWTVLDEAVLERPIGGREVMRAQLAHLLSFRTSDSVHVQVLPYSAGAHAGLPGSFAILRFDGSPDIAYTEGYDSGVTTVNPAEVRDRSLRYDLLQAAALSPEDSADLIASVMEDRYGEQN